MSKKLLSDVDSLVRTRLAGLKGTTETSYRGKWLRWEAFAQSRSMEAIPVTTIGVLLWLRQDLAYTVRMKHVQPYLSALNKCHEHLELEPAAIGPEVVAARKAIAQQQAAVFEETTRVRLPLEHAVKVMDAALSLKVSAGEPRSWRLLRGSVAMLVDLSCGSRGNTGVHLRSGDVQLLQGGRGGHLVRLRSLKGQVMVDELSGNEKVLTFPPDAVPGLVPLIRKWEDCRTMVGAAAEAKDSWYRLPGESKTWTWSVSQMNVFMAEVLAALDIVAPETFSYSWHSLRHAAASSCKAINVADSKIMWLHNWKSMQVAYSTYIDPLCPATPACYRFFGWLLPPARADLPLDQLSTAHF
eukprot:SAG11_NODE_1100_length_5869_cov_8.279896_4_plen_355_part_00